MGRPALGAPLLCSGMLPGSSLMEFVACARGPLPGLESITEAGSWFSSSHPLARKFSNFPASQFVGPIPLPRRVPKARNDFESADAHCASSPLSIVRLPLAAPIPSVRPSGAGLRFRRREPASPDFGRMAGVAVYKPVVRRLIATIRIRNILSLLARASHHGSSH
jgi:hypothetical protein